MFQTASFPYFILYLLFQTIYKKPPSYYPAPSTAPLVHNLRTIQSPEELGIPELPRAVDKRNIKNMLNLQE